MIATAILRGLVTFSFAIAATRAIAAGPPEVDAVRPDSGPSDGGTLLYVTGKNFSRSMKLFLGQNECEQVNVVNSTRLECITPAHQVAIIPIVLRTSGGDYYGTHSNFLYYRELELSPSSFRLPFGKKTVLSVSGGTPPYTFTIVKGDGTIDASGAFTAPDNPGSGLIQAKDADGYVGYSSYEIYTPLTILPETQVMGTDDLVRIVPMGGIPPYRATEVSGQGELFDGTFFFHSPAQPGKAVFRVSDAVGSTADATISFEYGGNGSVGAEIAKRQIAVGNEHSCAILEGKVLCWGSNAAGQLGNPSIKRNSTVPVKTRNLPEEVISISSGLQHTCALMKGGALKCWGDNRFGQLGDGTFQERREPVQVIGMESNVTGVIAGEMFTCAVAFHELFCWGRNDAGQLGNGTKKNTVIPMLVHGLRGRISAVGAGASHTCAVENEKTVKCWGGNTNGQLGRGDHESSLNAGPVLGLPEKVDALAAGWAHTCALSSGAVKCWGFNGIGTLGVGASSKKSKNVAADVSGLMSGVNFITGGQYHNCALSAGSVSCWGYNYQGQVGDSTIQNRAMPVPVHGLGATAIDVATGSSHSCALLEGSEVACWGENYLGQLGDGGNVSHTVPARVLLKRLK